MWRHAKWNHPLSCTLVYPPAFTHLPPLGWRVRVRTCETPTVGRNLLEAAWFAVGPVCCVVCMCVSLLCLSGKSISSSDHVLLFIVSSFNISLFHLWPTSRRPALQHFSFKPYHLLQTSASSRSGMNCWVISVDSLALCRLWSEATSTSGASARWCVGPNDLRASLHPLLTGFIETPHPLNVLA